MMVNDCQQKLTKCEKKLAKIDNANKKSNVKSTKIKKNKASES